MTKSKNKMKKPYDLKFQDKVMNSKFDLCKNFLYFLIAPLIIMLVGIILVSTVGFNIGTDFSGYSTFRVYVNSQNDFGENFASYDLDNAEDYKAVKSIIENTFDAQNLDIVSYKVTTMNIDDYLVIDGQAIEIDFVNTVSSENRQLQNENLREGILTAFGYQNDYPLAVSTVDYVQPMQSFNYIIALLAGIVFAIVVSMIYLSIRYNAYAFVSTIMICAIDILSVLSLLLIFRVVVSMTIGIIVLSTLILSLLNIFAHYSKMKYNIRTDKFAEKRAIRVSELSAKELLVKKTIIYICLILFSIIMIAISVPAVRQVGLGLLISVIVTYYTSTFILPAFVGTIYKQKKN